MFQMNCSEQRGGLPILIALALFAGAQAWDMAKAYEWPQYSGPMCEFKGKPLPRGEDGRARFDYFRRCYE